MTDLTDQERRVISACLQVNAAILALHGITDEARMVMSLRLKVLGELAFEDVTP